MKKEMIKGIEIKFNKEYNNYFISKVATNKIDYNILIIALLETINDICGIYNLNTNEQLEKYMKMGSIDNYCGEYDIQLKEKLKEKK